MTFRPVPARIAAYAILLTVLSAVLVVVAATAITDGPCWDDAPRCDRLNQIRANHSLHSLEQRGDLQEMAQGWAEHMAATGDLTHSPGTVPEVVGYGEDWRAVFAAFMDSPRHRAILLGDWTRVGIGAERAGRRAFVVVVFRDGG